MSKYGIKSIDKLTSVGIKPGELGFILGTDSYKVPAWTDVPLPSYAFQDAILSIGCYFKKISPKYRPTEHIFHDIHLGANGYVRHKARCGLVVGDLDTERPEHFAEVSRILFTRRCEKCIDLITDFEYINGTEV